MAQYTFFSNNSSSSLKKDHTRVASAQSVGRVVIRPPSVSDEGIDRLTSRIYLANLPLGTLCLRINPRVRPDNHLFRGCRYLSHRCIAASIIQASSRVTIIFVVFSSTSMREVKWVSFSQIIPCVRTTPIVFETRPHGDGKVRPNLGRQGSPDFLTRLHRVEKLCSHSCT